MAKRHETEVALATTALALEEQRTAGLVTSMEGVVIETTEQLAEAGEVLKVIKSRVVSLDDLRKGITRPMDASKKAVMDLFRPAETRLAQLERGTKQAILAFQRRREAEREAAQAELDRLAGLERQRLATLEAKQRETDHEDRAEVTVERREAVVAPVVAPVEKVKDVAITTRWHAEVHDLLELVRACGKDPELLAMCDVLLQPNMPELNRLARDLKEKFNFPGVKAVSEQGIAARA